MPQVHIILEYCAGGSLHRHLQGLEYRSGMPEQGAALVLYQARSTLTRTLAYLSAYRRCLPVAYTCPPHTLPFMPTSCPPSHLPFT